MKLHLHRAGRTSDWDAIDPKRRSLLQHVAANTGGTVTPGNVISTLGAGFVAFGLYDICHGNLGRGIIEIAVGRLADVLDGFVAESTHTKSPLGEALDATFDKLVLFSVLIVFVARDILPFAPAIAIVSLQAITAAVSLVAKKLKRDIHPTQAGKVATAMLWVALLLYGLVALVDISWLSVIANGIAAGAIVGGVLAAGHYARVAFAVQQK